MLRPTPLTLRLIDKIMTRRDKDAARVIASVHQDIPSYECVQTPRGHKEPGVPGKIREIVVRRYLDDKRKEDR